MYWAYLETEIGILKIVTNEEVALKVEIVPEKKEDHPCDLTLETKKQLEEYFAGKRKEFTIPIYHQGPPFQRKVFEFMKKVDYGTTLTYEEVAKSVNNPLARQAIGNTIKNNPLLILIPCHRIVHKDGHLAGFMYGNEVQQKLLDLEGIKL